MQQQIEELDQKYTDIETNERYVHDYGSGPMHPFRPRDRGQFEITGNFKGNKIKNMDEPRIKV